MASDCSRPHSTVVLLDDDQDMLRPLTCPLCHTASTLSHRALEAGAYWRCAVCGQHWDARRLAAVAAYAAWTIEHDRVLRQRKEVASVVRGEAHRPSVPSDVVR